MSNINTESKIDIKEIEEILLQVVKPGRYVGGEMNLPEFERKNPRVRIVLAFPDVYEVGMSYFGFKILYELINSYDEYQAERVFAPWVDMEDKMRKFKIPLYSLDTFTTVKYFDVIGFTLQHELTYTNILNMINLSGLEIKSCDRQQALPLIIAGGPCAFNPEPLADFVDCFVVGDGEEVIIEILNIVADFKAHTKKTKNDLLKRLAGIKGIYVPSFYNITYKENLAVKKFEKLNKDAPDKIEKKIVDISNGSYPVRKPLVPYLNIIQDRFIIEVRRGCTRGCRFCNAGIITRPVRERAIENILETAQTGIDNTGFKEISLLSLSTTDHTTIEPIVRYLSDAFSGCKVSVTLPSLRIDSFDINLARKIIQVRKSGLTFAPEAGTERLRTVINKPISQKEFFSVIKDIFIAGWRTIKLYFMIGLPTETYEDLDGIAEMVKEIRCIAKKTNARNLQINVTLSPFIPKPDTPFQWESLLEKEEIEKRYRYVKDKIRARNVSVKRHNIEQTFIEAVFSRGDRRLGKALQFAFENGCKFDSWDEIFKSEKWQDVFEKANINPKIYTNPDITFEDVLPWEHISAGVNKKYLISEKKLSESGVISGDCIYEQCVKCGVCSNSTKNVLAKSKELNLYRINQIVSKVKEKSFYQSRQPLLRVRVKFTKEGILKFISHLDLIKSLNILLSRTNLNLFYTAGFNPQIKIQYSPPLPIGFESKSEYFDVYLSEHTDHYIILGELQNLNQKYLKFIDAQQIPLNATSLEASIISANYKIIVHPFEENKMFFNKSKLIEKVKEFYSKPEFLIDRKRSKGIKTIDLRKIIYKIYVEENIDSGIVFNCITSMGKRGTFNPLNALDLILELDIEKVGRWNAIRTGFGFARTKGTRT